MADDITVCAFNRRGNLLAAAAKRRVVWDFDTHGVAQQLLGHTEKVTAVSWTRSSRGALVLVGGQAHPVDVLTATATQTVVLGGEISHAALHPRRRASPSRQLGRRRGSGLSRRPRHGRRAVAAAARARRRLGGCERDVCVL